MPANTKPVPWNDIKRRYEAGEAENAIAEDLTAQGNKISKQAIRKRRMKEGWKVNPSAAKVRDAATEWQQFAATGSATGNQLATGPSRSATQIANWGKRTPENAALILASLSETGDKKLAAITAGIDRKTLDRWRESDEDFGRKCLMAEAEFASKNLGHVVKAGERGDWKASQWLLQTNELTRDTYGQADSGGNGLTVNFNFALNRGTIPRDEDIIEIETVNG